jgi:hypothetical protein
LRIGELGRRVEQVLEAVDHNAGSDTDEIRQQPLKLLQCPEVRSQEQRLVVGGLAGRDLAQPLEEDRMTQGLGAMSAQVQHGIERRRLRVGFEPPQIACNHRRLPEAGGAGDHDGARLGRPDILVEQFRLRLAVLEL